MLYAHVNTLRHMHMHMHMKHALLCTAKLHTVLKLHTVIYANTRVYLSIYLSVCAARSRPAAPPPPWPSAPANPAPRALAPRVHTIF